MGYFEIITNVIMYGLAGFGVFLLLFVVIRDNFFPVNDKDQSDKGSDSNGCYEDLW